MDPDTVDQATHAEAEAPSRRTEAVTIVVCVAAIVGSILVSALRVAHVIGP